MAVAGQAWDTVGAEEGSSWLQSFTAGPLEKLFMNPACLRPGNPATRAGAFHRRATLQVLEHHTEPLSRGHGVFQSGVCVGHTGGGRGSGGLRASASGALLQEGKGEEWALGPSRT